MRHIYLVPLILASCTSKEPPLTGKRESVIVANFPLEAGANKTISVPNLGTQSFTMHPKELWCYEFYDLSINGNAMTASPLAYKDHIFVIDAGGIVHCLDRRTGKLNWKVSTTVAGETGQSGAAISAYKDTLLVSNSFCDCLFIDIKTGKFVSRIKLPAPCKGDGLLVENGVAYFSCLSNTIHAIDIDSKRVLWTYSGTDREDGYTGMAKPLVIGEKLIAALTTGELLCFDKHTGRQIWKTFLSNYSVTDSASAIQHLRTNLATDGKAIYVSSPAGITFAIDAGNGDEIWKQHIGGKLRPNVTDTSIFITNDRSEVVRLNKLNGRVENVYKVEIEKKQRSLFDKLTFSNNTNNATCVAQFLINNSLLHITDGGEFIYTSYKNGEKLHTFHGKKNVRVVPALNNGELFLISDDGYLVSYGEKR